VATLARSPRAGTTLLLGDYDEYDSQNWVPVFASTWDFNGAVQLLYRDPTLFGYPVLPGFGCASTGLSGLPNASSDVPYHEIVFVDVGRHLIADVNKQATCAAVSLLGRLFLTIRRSCQPVGTPRDGVHDWILSKPHGNPVGNSAVATRLVTRWLEPGELANHCCFVRA